MFHPQTSTIFLKLMERKKWWKKMKFLDKRKLHWTCKISNLRYHHTWWKLWAASAVARPLMDFSRASSTLEARALASSMLEALIISLTTSSTQSAPSLGRLFSPDGSSVTATSPFVAAEPDSKYWSTPFNVKTCIKRTNTYRFPTWKQITVEWNKCFITETKLSRKSK